ncbi:MAG: phosphotransferase [Deltaproteobacteria bacterium]|nr:phosphotransferase [Deltaproteobacteria bacterium]MBW2363129.1 phosphotransferase [Deltaproteobacteria bacterium]
MRESGSLAAANAAARAFAGPAPVGALAPLGSGLIHQTFAAPLGGAPAHELVLQRLNTKIFAQPHALMRNLERITEHLRESRRAEGSSDLARRVLEVLHTSDGSALFEDAEGGLWRAFPRIVDGVALGSNRDPARLTSAARAFGDYAQRLATLPGPPLLETLPHFHDFARRRRAFDAAVAADPHSRAADAGAVLDALRRACEALERALPEATVDALPRRIAHHDCKLDNLLFDVRSGEALCVLDLDTSMPGRLLSDFGELVRSATTSGADESDASSVRFDQDAFSALACGYLRELANTLTPAERETLPLAGARMALMNAVRFATDHLEGDIYFRLLQPGQNLERARTQLALTEAMLAAEDELRERLVRASVEL